MEINEALRWDFEYALAEAGVKQEEVATVERDWCEQGDYAELEMRVVGTMTDGRWFLLAGGCDTTGWGCQDYAYIYYANSEQELVDNCITEEDRGVLGYSRITPDEVQ